MLGRIFRKEDNKDICRIQVSFILGIAEGTKPVRIFRSPKIENGSPKSAS
jgi:hypothetical protein